MLIVALRALLALPPAASDTPPMLRVPAPQISELRGPHDALSYARLLNGQPAPPTVRMPSITNSEDLLEFTRQHYPESAQSTPAAMPVAWIYVDGQGNTHFEKLIVTTGDVALDSLASAVAARAKFSAATVAGTAIPIWLPVRLDVRRHISPGPLSPPTVKPLLLNRDQVSRKLIDEYRPHLRQMGTRRRVMVWALVDENGFVAKTEVKESSGSAELDQAARNVAHVMRFSPARHMDRPLSVWIQMPIVFQTR